MKGASRAAEPAGRLFVAETVGQVRNAAAAASQAPGGSAALLLLLPSGNPGLAARIEAFAAGTGLPCRAVPLPETPHRPSPGVIARHLAAFAPVVDGPAPEELWVANGRFHLAWIAGRMERRGARIVLYEDGLSSYRRADDPSFDMPGAAEALARAGEKARADLAMIRRALGKGRFGPALGAARWMFGGLAEGAARAAMLSAAGRAAARLRVGPEAAAFFASRRRFDAAWMAFPEAFDAAGFGVGAARPLVIAPSPGAIARARAALAPVEPGEALHVSQVYGGGAVRRAVARALAAAGARRLLVKPHPRETEEERAALLADLAKAGVEARSAPASLDEVEAEALIETGLFRTVFGLTSTALLHGVARRPDVEFVPVGEDALARLAKAGRPERLHERFAADVALFGRMRRAILSAPGP